jgi:hypothetical protein
LKKKRRTEISILAILGIIATCLFAGIAVLFAYEVADRRGLLASAAPLPTLTVISHPIPLVPAPTALPVITSTPVPRPTNTLVISKETVNDRILQEVEQKMVFLRNLSPQRPVPNRFLTVEELQQLLTVWYAQESPADEVRVKQQLYLALGFLKKEDDLSVIEGSLMARSVAGMYNAVDKKLYIVSDRWNMTASEEMTFAHEFTHAMQDQYYNLQSLDERARTLDVQLATLSLIEGDATLSMSLYAIRNLSQSDVNEMIYRAAQLKQDQLVNVPPAITQITLFPYQAGLRFAQVLYQHSSDWSLVNAAFAVPPLSTEQIMHVEKYLTEPDVPLPIALPALDEAIGGRWREIDRGVLGEYLLGLHLEQGLASEKAWEAAAGWGGDSYALLVDDQGRWLLVMRSTWDTPQDAREFFDVYTQMTGGRSEAQQILVEQGRGYWRLPDREVYVGQHDRDALVIISPDRTSLDRALYWFPGY